MQKDNKTYVIYGQIIDQRGQKGIEGFTIKAFELENETKSVGEATSDSKGDFLIKIKSNSLLYSKGELFFKVSKGRTSFLPSTRWFMHWYPQEPLKKIIININPEKREVIQPKNKRKLTGRVVEPDGTQIPKAGLIVEAFNIGMKDKKWKIGESITNNDGSYELGYWMANLPFYEKKDADILIALSESKALDNQHRKTQLYISPIRYNAKELEHLDLAVDNPRFRGLSEFEKLTAALEPTHQRIPAAQWGKNDLEFLAGKSGQQLYQIAFLSEATRLSDSNQKGNKDALPPQLLYAFFRQQVPSDIARLLSHDPTRLRQALDEAFKANIVSFDQLAGNLDQSFEYFKTWRKKFTVDRFNPIFETVPKFPEGKYTDFVDKFINREGSTRQFWEEVSKPDSPFAGFADELFFTLQLGMLCWGHTPLIEKLKGQSILSLKEFSKWDIPRWLEVLKNVSLPEPIATSSKEVYAQALVSLVERTYPTSVIAYRITDEKRPEERDIIQFFKNIGLTDTQSFKNNTTRVPEFNIIWTDIDSFIKRNKDTSLYLIENEKGLIWQLKEMQRFARITPAPGRMAAIRTLQKEGFTSARNIAALGQKQFINKMGKKLGNASQARIIHAKARRTTAFVTHFLQEYHPFFNHTDTRVTKRPIFNKGTDIEASRLSGLTGWEEMFGAVESCRYEHCQTVLSPAAYLFELLDFLKNEGPCLQQHDGDKALFTKSPFDLLMERRPEIAHIKLNCDNALIPVPYIDLVNEVLENAVSPGGFTFTIEDAIFIDELNHGVISEKLINAFSSQEVYPLSSEASLESDTYGKRWRITEKEWEYALVKKSNEPASISVFALPLYQTKGLAAELRANPAYLNPSAYDVLKEAIFPWNLPFDLHNNEARLYFENFGVPRYHLMELLQTEQGPTQEQVCCEYFGMPWKEWGIITGETSENPWLYWGLPDGNTWIPTLQSVSKFLEQSGLEYEEMEELLKTTFIQALGELKVEFEKGSCAIKEAALPGLNEDHLRIIHRFVRLWRRLGWSMHDLDTAISVLNNGILDRELMKKLKIVHQLNRDYKVPVIQMLSWWGFIDTKPGGKGKTSLYEQIFLNKTVLNPVDDLFVLNEDRDELKSFSEAPGNKKPRLADVKSALQAALRISEYYLDLLIDQELITSIIDSSGEITTSLDKGEIPNAVKILLESKSILSSDARVERVTPGKVWKIKKADLTLTLQVSQEDEGGAQKILILFGEKPETDGLLNLANLSTLYRWVSLAKAKKCTVSEILSAKWFLGKNPFQIDTDFSPEQTLNFICDLDLLLDIKISSLDLDYLLQSHSLGSSLELSQENITTFLSNLRIELQRLGSTYLLEPDPYGEKTKANWRLFLNKRTGDQDWNEVELAQIHAIIERTPYTYLNSIGIEWKDALNSEQVSKPLSDEFAKKGLQIPQNTVIRRHSNSSLWSIEPLSGMVTIREEALQEAVILNIYEEAILEPLVIKESVLHKYFCEILTLDWGEVRGKLLEPESNNFISIVADRFAFVLGELFDQILHIESKELVVQKIAEFLNIEKPVAEELFNRWMPRPVGSAGIAIDMFLDSGFVNSDAPVSFGLNSSLYRSLTKWYKAGSIIQHFKLQKTDLPFIFQQIGGWRDPGMDLNALSYELRDAAGPIVGVLKKLAGFYQFCQRLGIDLTDLMPLISMVMSPVQSDLHTFESALSERTGWPLKEIKQAVQFFNYQLNSFIEIGPWLRLEEVFQVVKRTGVAPNALNNWKTFQLSDTEAREIKQTLRSRYSEEQWESLSKPLIDPLRQKRRDSLVAYLLQDGRWADANDLYAHFLIDTEMSACMMTSRILLATSSVQLFVQRLLMNLEEWAVDSNVLPVWQAQWEWMKNYRVWEANRKIFLFPENWTEPELRDDKTPFFRELEEELLQSEANAENVEKAYLHYLEKLDEVARLEICGQYHEQEKIDDQIVIDRLHVFGRTKSDPPKYFYRFREDGVWTAWEPVNLDIKGDYLFPLVWNRRLFLLWPVFEEKVETINNISNDERTLESLINGIKKEFGDRVAIFREIKSALDIQMMSHSINQTSKIRDLLLQLSSDDSNSFTNLLVKTKEIKSIIDNNQSNISNALREDLPDLLSMKNEAVDILLFFYRMNSDGSSEGREPSKLEYLTISQLLFSLSKKFDVIQNYIENFNENKNKKSESVIKTWSIRLAWSEFRYNKWTAKVVSQIPLHCDTFPKAYFFFTSASNSDNFAVHVYNVISPFNNSNASRLYVGSFSLSKSDFKLDVIFDKSLHNDPRKVSFFFPYNTYYFSGRIIKSPDSNDNSFKLWVADESEIERKETEIPLFSTTQLPFYFLIPHQVQDFLGQVPFFFEDTQRTFLATPSGKIRISDPPDNDPGDPSDPPPPDEGGPGIDNPPVGTVGPGIGVVEIEPPYNPKLGYEKMHIPEDIYGIDVIRDIVKGLFDGDIVSDLTNILNENNVVLREDTYVESLAGLGRGEEITGEIDQIVGFKIGDGTKSILVDVIQDAQGIVGLDIQQDNTGGLLQEENILTEPVNTNILGAESHDFPPLKFLANGNKPRASNLRLFAATQSDSIIDVSGLSFQFEIFYHPYVREFINAVRRQGIDGLLNLKSQQSQSLDFFDGYYPTNVVKKPDSPEQVDFSIFGSYAQYNWELFFHIPLLIADSLSKNQQFEKAQQWFHFIFNPTSKSSDPIPERYWQTKPFFKYFSRNTDLDLSELIKLIKQETDELEKQIEIWEKKPFKPHVIARLRDSTYPMVVVMKYLDNLISWGDNLFQRDTIEAINEATQIYILAAEILGTKPQILPKSNGATAESFAELAKLITVNGFDGGTWAKVENYIAPFYEAKPILFSSRQNQMVFGKTLWLPVLRGKTAIIDKEENEQNEFIYFGIPENTKLLGYWETLADRLFKIRHCMNIEGVVRQLPLFAPPIDPGLLVRAAAAGLDIGDAISSLFTPLPNYRFTYIYQRAVDFCNDVKNLGNALLAALEKKDAESLSLLRVQHEQKVLQATRAIKEKSIEEADFALKSLEQTLAISKIKETYYRSRKFINSGEKAQLDLMITAHMIGMVGQMLEMAASTSYPVPDINIGALVGMAGGPITVNKVGGGEKIAQALQAFGKNLGMMSSFLQLASTMSGILAGYARRKEEWDFQAAIALAEQLQIDKQILAAEIRKAIAETDLTNHDLQIEQADEVARFMEDKFTNKQLYNWMTGKLSVLYFQSYQMALKLAQQAEKALVHELGLENVVQIRPSYWNNLKKGLLSGEQLYNDLKQLELTYLEKNKREFELSKHISLALTNPIELLKLRETGECFFNIPEILFDLDHPGHYLRRIKSVSLTIPCVAGPYTPISAKLTLMSNRYRKNPKILEGYIEGLEDPRFVNNVVGIQAIATSHAQNDSGLFELNFRDERYLPFEGAGAISSWRLELPTEFRQFDYDTISDVIIQMNYTARDGGDTFKQMANANLRENINIWLDASKESGFKRLFSLKDEFPKEWNQLLTEKDHTTKLEISHRHFPLMMRDRKLTVNAVYFYLEPAGAINPLPITLVGVPNREAPFNRMGLKDSNMHVAEFKHLDEQIIPDAGESWTAEVIYNNSGGIYRNMYMLVQYEVRDRVTGNRW